MMSISGKKARRVRGRSAYHGRGGAFPLRGERGWGPGFARLHGDHAERAPLGEALSEEGFTVMGPRLEGHGTSMEDHASTTASDWISSIEAGLTWLQQRTSQTFFTGLSLGGMFALYFAAKYPNRIRGIVPINACVFLNDPDLAHVVPPENGPHILERLGGEDKELVWLENSYHVATLDNDADLIVERSVRFIREHGG